MVSRVYHDNEEPTLRRYSSRGHGYPLSQDREMYSPQNHGIYPGHRQHMPSHESRNNELSPDHDSGSRPRSRIPVACGRCRKRKIRCSGDTGGPCTNCKQAGNNDCAFLRVSSTEAQMKSETSYEYDPPGSAASRVNCRMLPYGPQAYGSHGGLPTDTYTYRGTSVASYQYPVKPQQYYATPAFPEYNEETLDYGLPALQAELSPSQQLNNPSNYTTSYTRGWTPTPQPQFPKNPLFLEQADSTFNHGHLPYHGNSYPLRTSISQELKSTSLNPLGASLPVPVAATTDRILPFPAGRPSQGGPYVRNAENFIPTAQTNLQYSDYSSRQVRGNHDLPGSEILPITHTPYLSISASSTDSMTSSQIGYNSQQFTLNQHHDENSSNQNEALYQQSNLHGELYSTSDSEPTYGHQDSPQSKRGSHSSHATNIDVSVPSSHGNLVNGYQYVPPPHNEAVYPIPAMSMPHHHNTPVTTQSRRLSSAIAAS